jgi:peroxiredoxin
MKPSALAALFACLLLAAVPAPAKGPHDALTVGPKVGMKLPVPLEVLDHKGRPANRTKITGANGLILLFSRSVGWCVYCKGEAVDWNANLKRARALGFNVAVITYDAPATIARFMRQQKIGYPILSDKGSRLIKTYGLLNKRHQPGSFAHGIPHPITFVIDRNGVIRYRFSESGYNSRPNIGVILKTIRADKALNAAG